MVTPIYIESENAYSVPEAAAGLTSGRFHRSRALVRRSTWCIITLLVTAIVLGSLYQLVSLAYERQTHPMPGRLVDIGGYKLHIDCVGEGSPTVILDSGFGDSFLSWKNVQPNIGSDVRVCSYDRAGTGYSEASPWPRTSIFFVQELHQLLRNAGIPTPYILVGHSMAAYDIRLYASIFRSDVAGLVFVDGSHPDQMKRFPRALDARNAEWIREGMLLQFTMPIGIPRLIGYCGDSAVVRAAECTYSAARENAAERKTFRESAALAKDATIGSGIPLVVVSRDPYRHDSDLPADLERAANIAWEQMQEELTSLAPHGTRVIAKGSGHYIQNDRPDIVIESIRNMIAQVR
jgi:pimeloyl-ACP methyl ester carboxylesterase